MITAPAFVTVNPSFIEPGYVLPYNQSSGYLDSLAGGKPLIRLGEGDLYVYMKRIDMRVQVQAGQVPGNQLPSAFVEFSQFSTPTYLQRVNATWDHHDVASVGRWGMSVVELERLATRQGHFQQNRNAALYGYQPANGEGLVNANGATAVTLPADSNGNTTVLSYDNGQLAFFLLQQILNLKTRCYQLGIPRRFNILGPQRILGQMQYPNIVQLTQFQRVGGGTDVTAGLVKKILEENGDVISWTYDDTLEGKGAGGTDLVILNMPEVEKQTQAEWDTNTFAVNVEPGINACTAMYADMAAPREIMSPLPNGATQMLTEMRTTPGWAIRGETITLISMAYDS